jgi:hypothetical protein
MCLSYAPLLTPLSPKRLLLPQRPQPLFKRMLRLQIVMFTIDPAMHLLRQAQCNLSTELLHVRRGVWAV